MKINYSIVAGEWMLSVNEKGLEIAEEMMDWAEELKVKTIELKNDARVM
jgi:methenyltetrahydromethanopterin cyclohydrolase